MLEMKNNIELSKSLFNLNEDADGDPKPKASEVARFAAWVAKGKKERFAVVTEITPGLAVEMLKRNTNNRPFSSAMADKYAAIMADDRWKLTSEAIAFAKQGHLIDGQHRLHAVAKSDTSVQMTVWFGCQEDEFSAINLGRGRTAGDMIAIDKMDNWVVRASVAQLALRVETKSVKSHDAGRVFIRARQMDGETMENALAFGSRCKKISGVSPACFAYWYIHQNTSYGTDKVNFFFDAFVSGANLNKKSPILRVREHIRTADRRYNSRETSIKIVAALIIAWNAHVKNQVGRTFTWDRTVYLPEVV